VLKGLEVPLNRISHRPGDLLTACDMRDHVGHDGRLRWLHNRYLHDTWGIALGLEVRIADGGKNLRVGPGLALDDRGRELVLAQNQAVSLPSAIPADRLVLVIRYQEDAEFRERSGVAEVCASGEGGFRSEQPVFAWKLPDQVQFGPQVPLAVAEISGGQVDELDLRVRRYARPLERPYIASGVTEPGRTGWAEWKVGDTVLGLQVTVDTSEAGFVETPFYFPSLHADASLLAGDLNDPQLKEMDLSFSPQAYQFVASPGESSFIYRIIRREAALSASEANDREWYVSWFGLEPVRGCRPSGGGPVRPPHGVLIDIVSPGRFTASFLNE
jgi:hypothetical protein